MDEDASPADIARLEEHIEALRLSIARCRKIARAAKLVIAAGAGILVFTVLGLVPFITVPFIAAIAAVIGGCVLAGSNSTTWKQMQARLQNSEALRAETIGKLKMRTVGDDGIRRLH
jgi:hypothetical protein